ncbi:uncharacterized protein LOC143508769 [Brachyhypopomus gauderio]|uniref:uncharacterized protein LOC143508769 n=1 Tax=Brachyhypopomus gauderio TaxID=698409 RepID=UPI00404268F0
MLQGLRGELPEHVTISDTKQWLVYKGKNTFKTMYQKFMKWSDPQCAELVWELSHRFQLEELEKKIIRELRLEGQGQEQLENLSRFLSRARPVLSISSNERNNTSAEDDMTVENLHNLIKKTTTSLTREVKENLASVMLEVLHEECSTPCSRTDSSSDFIPVSSKEDVDQIAEEPIVTAVSCQDSVSPVISGTASKEYRSSVLLNAVGLSGHSSGYSLGSGAKRALSKTKVDCSNQESSSAVKLISNPPSESSDSPSSAKLDNNNEIVLRVVDITVTKMMMETFRLHSSSPELATLIQDFVSVVSSHPQHEFILWLRSAVVETVMEQFFETEVTDVGDATGGESLADTVVAIGETATEMPKMEETPTVTDVGDATGGESLEDTVVAIGENATEMPKMEETPAGSRPKKVKRVRAFFRRAWQAVKRTFCCCH